MTLSAQMKFTIVATDDNTDELSRLVDYLNLSRGVTFSEGEGANQINMVWHDQRSLADGANETLDFHDGSLTNKVGVSITMDKIKALYIKNNSSEASLIIGGAVANQLGLFADGADKLVLPPGGELPFIAPGASGVDCSSNSDLKLEHDGTGSSELVYDIVVFGVDTE